MPQFVIHPGAYFEAITLRCLLGAAGADGVMVRMLSAFRESAARIARFDRNMGWKLSRSKRKLVSLPVAVISGHSLFVCGRGLFLEHSPSHLFLAQDLPKIFGLLRMI